MDDPKKDPIGDAYYRPLTRAERISDIAFFVSAALSFAAVLLPKSIPPALHDIVHSLFALSVIVLFVASLVVRLYFFPRAQIARQKDFLSHAYSKELGHRKSDAYYNNSATTVSGRVAAQVLESAFFSKSVLAGMAASERTKAAIYLFLWFALVFWRGTDITWIAVAAQAVFCEQIVSRWLRFEALKLQCEQIYDHLFAIYKTKRTLDVKSAEMYGQYEIWKATTGFSTSSKVFNRHRLALNAEWEDIRKTLGI